MIGFIFYSSYMRFMIPKRGLKKHIFMIYYKANVIKTLGGVNSRYSTTNHVLFIYFIIAFILIRWTSRQQFGTISIIIMEEINMYNIELFEQLIKSKLTSEQIYKKITEINPIQTEKKYSNDEEEPFAIYVGGVGKEDLVTINNHLYPIKMRFDSEQIYIDFINLIRKKLKSIDKPFRDIVLSSIRNLSKNWFYMQTTSESIENAKLAQAYLTTFKHPGRQRDGYAGDKRVSVFDEENGEFIYNISKFAGTGDLAKCVEINSVACNLLNFSGIHANLIQGYFINYAGKQEAHTFPIYKGDNGNYCLLDCALKQQKKDILPNDINFEEGFSFEVPVVLNYSDGRKENSNLKYKISPQKLITSSKGIKK